MAGLRSLSVCAFLLLLPQLATASSFVHLNTDYGVYGEPPLPTLPAAGGVFLDPAFGTPIMRVSDEQDGPNNLTAYSHWPTFNVDSTRLHFSGETPTLYEFDPETFTLGEKSTLWSSTNLNWEDSVWSGIDPDVIYARRGLELYSHNVATRETTLVKDFSTALPDGVSAGHLGHMSRSLDDNRFAFMLRSPGPDYDSLGYIAWDRGQDELLLHQEEWIHAVHLDKSGEHLLVKTGQQGRGVIESRVFNLDEGQQFDLVDDAPDYSPGHYDLGVGKIVGTDNWRKSITIRDADTPHESDVLIQFEDWKNGPVHLSMLGDNEDWIVVSSNSNEPVNNAFDNEIFLLATDGSGEVRRVAHHRSVFNSYWDSARANVSRDGNFIAFTSNWGDSGRRDVFIASLKSFLYGDLDNDGDVDIQGDMLKAFSNFTGPGDFQKTRAEGDVGPLPGGDGDVDSEDLMIIYREFTGPGSEFGQLGGAAEAGDPAVPDLVYDAATGEVILDADGSSILAYVLQTTSNGFLPDQHTTILDSVGTTSTSELSEFALTPGSGSIGAVFPVGLNLAGLTALLSANEVILALGTDPVAFDLVVVNASSPEPAAAALAALALAGLALYGVRRRRSPRFV